MPDKDTYQKLYDTTKYGKASENCCPGVRSFKYYRNYLKGKIIDIGCGTGDTVLMLRNHKYQADGIDQIKYTNDMIVGDASTYDYSEYDTALSIDVFEHLTEEEITNTLKAMSKTDRQIIQVHCGKSGFERHDNLHISIKTKDEWQKVIGQHLNIQAITQISNMQYIFYCGDTKIEVPQFMIPSKFNTRPIWNKDGSFFIPRDNRALEQYLERHCIKLGPRHYYPACHIDKNIMTLQYKHKDKTVYIVGKGPSLDDLDASYFDTDGPVICINDSIHHIPDLSNPLYCIQNDRELGEECLPINGATLLLNYVIDDLYKNYDDKFFFDRKALKLSGPTAATAIEIAKIMGCNKIVMLCFDSCVNKKTAHAKCVGYDSTRFGLKPERFLDQRAKLDKFLTIDHEWIIPTKKSSHDEASCDKPQQLLDNPVEHHEQDPDHMECSSASPATTDSPLQRGRVHQRMIADRLDIGQST